MPNGGLITETNAQYYAGAQGFSTTAPQQGFTFTFDTPLNLGDPDPAAVDYALNNFKLYASSDGITYLEVDAVNWPAQFPYTLEVQPNGNSFINLAGNLPASHVLVCQLKTIDGGSFGSRDAYGMTTEENYGSYAYVTLQDIVNNFIVGYVGEQKLIPNIRRSDIIFHAKRGLQEFSYDTLKSIKSQELTIPPSLSVIIPQDYVNYVQMSRIDDVGVKHIIYPTRLTSNPYNAPVQDSKGVPTQNSLGANIEGSSLTNARWKSANQNDLTGLYDIDMLNAGVYNYFWYDFNYGRRYGLDPETSQMNGWFTINEREGKFSFSSDLQGELLILDYISDGLAVDTDMKIPKMAEEAIYMHILYNILAGRANVPEYVVARYKKERRAALRNAKIRLSDIKLEEFTQVMRGKSKWIKH